MFFFFREGIVTDQTRNRSQRMPDYIDYMGHLAIR